MEPLALSDQDMGLPLQDSLGPELLQLLDDLGGEDGWCAAGQGVGTALETADLGRPDVLMDDASGIPMPQDPQRPVKVEHSPIKADQLQPPMVGFALASTAHRLHTLDGSHSGNYSELLPPQSAFQQQPIMAPVPAPPTPAHRLVTQKPRSIRRARSGLPAHLQSRSSSEPQEVLRRANSGGGLQETQKQASKQVLSSSPKSTSTIFRPFLPLAAVEVLAEVRRGFLCNTAFHHGLFRPSTAWSQNYITHRLSGQEDGLCLLPRLPPHQQTALRWCPM